MSPSSDTTNPEPLATANSRFEKIILEGQRWEHVAELQPAASLKGLMWVGQGGVRVGEGGSGQVRAGEVRVGSGWGRSGWVKT